jgi:two-component system response regulator RegA
MSQHRLLLVDDDKVFCAALATALRRRGHEVLIAHNVSEALEEALLWKPDRIVTDLRMPDEDGLSLIRRFNEDFPDAVIIVLTGYGSIATAVEAVKLGAIQYLTKPVSADDVLRAFEGIPFSESAEEAAERAPPLELVEWEHLQRVLQQCEGNISEAARRLNLHRRTLQRKLSRGRGTP